MIILVKSPPAIGHIAVVFPNLWLYDSHFTQIVICNTLNNIGIKLLAKNAQRAKKVKVHFKPFLCKAFSDLT
jgi:hypothetical protein